MRHEHGEVNAKDGQVYSIETGKTFALIPYWDETEEQEFDQDLIAEAFNVAYETGLTPRELQQANIKLLDALKELMEVEGGEPNDNEESVLVSEKCKRIIDKA